MPTLTETLREMAIAEIRRRHGGFENAPNGDCLSVWDTLSDEVRREYLGGLTFEDDGPAAGPVENENKRTEFDDDSIGPERDHDVLSPDA